MISLDNYIEIVGNKVIAEIFRKARRLNGKQVLHINSTYQGGGVAEILHSLVPLMNDVGIDTDWNTLHGNPDFFTITKRFHNALQGDPVHLTKMKKKLYLEANEDFSKYNHIHHDCVIIHDPQPMPLIKVYKKKQPWVWRCHIDLSNPNSELWEFLSQFLIRYDMAIISNESYRQKGLAMEQRVIYPAIDPVNSKNKELSDKDISKYLKKFGIDTDKPIISQVSRFDKWKDPEGVLKVFKLVKKEIDCRLVLCGSLATDDPEGPKLYERIKKNAEQLMDNGDVVLIISENNILVNALQRSSGAVIQKSIREGFCLAVTEALWKGTPVVASNVGGIPVQIKDGESGFLVEPDDTRGFADRVIKILNEPELAREVGEKGKETVRKNFLITRLLEDYLDLLSDVVR